MERKKPFMAEWLKEWIAKNRKHRTMGQGGTLVCPKQMDLIDIHSKERLNFCPLCGENLGKPTKIKDYADIYWEH